MYCGECGQKINEEDEYCPKCGIKLPAKEDNKIIYKKEITPINFNNNLGIITIGLSLLTMIFIFICYEVSIVLGILSFISMLITIKRTNKYVKIISIITSMLAIIIALFSLLILISKSLDININNNKISVYNYVKESVLLDYDTFKINGAWNIVEDNTKTLISINNDGTYYCYTDSSNLNDNYFYGSYEISKGMKVEDQTVYFDDDYYYYTFDVVNASMIVNGSSSKDNSSIFKNGFFFKLSKKDSNKAVIAERYSTYQYEIIRK